MMKPGRNFWLVMYIVPIGLLDYWIIASLQLKMDDLEWFFLIHLREND